MTEPVHALCYHRVLDPAHADAGLWPYFARGTAVDVEAFERQIEAVAEHFDVVLPDPTRPEVWPAPRGRPRCWITFDDGYRDVRERALPVLARLGLRATVFVTACTLQEPPEALPADRWYAVLTSVERRVGTLVWGSAAWAFDLARDADRARLVDGPERRDFLRAPRDAQRTLLARLADALGGSDAPPAGTYLTPEHLRELAGKGWAIGAHGATHALFPCLSRETIEQELEAIDEAFRRHALAPPRTFAWPDGASSGEGTRALVQRGYVVTASLGDVRADPARLPDVARYIVRNDARWVEGLLGEIREGGNR